MKMKLENKRVYISYLPTSISQADLEQKFSEYGSVRSVEIKNRKSSVHSEEVAQFAYVSLTVTDSDLSTCFDEFANQKFKGHWLNLQEAKESFIDRLKRERADDDTKPKVSVVTAPKFQPTVSYTNPKFKKAAKVYYSSGSEEEEVVKKDHGTRNPKLEETRKDEVSNGKPSSVEQVQNGKCEKTSEADKKRLQSIIRMRQNYVQQKQVLKNALSKIDSKPKNKIIFDEDNSENETSSVKRTTNNSNHPNEKRKRALFDEEDAGDVEHESYNFEIKEQFEGKKGQKLLELQSRFKNDKRFVMNEHFLEDEEVEEENHIEEDEKQMQFKILDALEKSDPHTSLEKRGKFARQNVKMMLRFDPSQPTHSKFEIREDQKKKPKAIENKESAKESEEYEKPEVSKETFYKIAVNLKDALHEKEEFSLANLFNHTIETAESERFKDPVVNHAKSPKRVYQEETDLFHCNSSADEDEAPINANKETVQTSAVSGNRVGPAKLWTESFFFKHDDYRLQEGLDFIKRLEVDEQTDFQKLRRNLHEIVKAKVRNNLRKNRPFRKKLGGKKRLRVKRALKR